MISRVDELEKLKMMLPQIPIQSFQTLKNLEALEIGSSILR
jgi:hypothetical protein